ncbi:MAG: hypothetical protein CO030_01120 [Candidatus Magasanikbacteria bacterium CG_4_9_14_0_2_um_filter_42_11]|uniref:Uncharacterized protein n=1 Tax=Candidatus Magasanikbacteria bacterium CG_4_9_14_0_2_um_filter_42_11 TaxID=1974643 RepID=A0A2M8FAM1_9BACT|nr:MAG: hypothetical protein COU34_02830 [Candidatus Magasanikbacteria bacterium CG10_big_fil_rev_8_21_14_0_10_43_9]PIY92480.1 MAG: hypothetical protein COY70_03000 [Candidatus Magasanikbacteria bacterium CG_4_10_14_0_8_um_filter_42_12]PJC52782.1 MAG: hypothetical protein CO030_01120 [Candidatus Magasanikbacteria bacterium CG_4_9_14_0_2_um_filter_42_11]
MLTADAGGDIGLAIVLAAFLSIVPVIGPIIAIILVVAVVADTCTGSLKGHRSKVEQKDHPTYMVKLHELNPNEDQVFKYPEAEIRVNYQH